jgi:ubiquinone/menaquinone biosynthesis C-methylase UbiE
LIDNPLRRLFHDTEEMLGTYLKPGMITLDVGCGMGFFTIPMAKMVGSSGRVIAVDVQQRMLDNLMYRARRAGVDDRIIPYHCAPDDIGMHGPVDFASAMFSVHEAPDALRLLRQIRANMRDGAWAYVAEPTIEVSEASFETMLGIAETAGFAVLRRPEIRLGRAVVLTLEE